MKNAIFAQILSLFVVFSAHAQYALSASDNYDLILLHSPNTSYVKNNILMYRSVDFKETPEIIISNQSLFVGKKEYFFKDFNICMGSGECEKNLNLEFIKFDQFGIYLKVDDYSDSVASTTFGGKKLYFKIDSNNFFNRAIGNNSIWRKILFPSEKKKIEDVLEIKKLASFREAIGLCILNKSIKCLEDQYDPNEQSNKNELKEQVLARAMLEDKKLCDEFTKDQYYKDWLGVFPEKIIKKADLKHPVFWNELSKAIDIPKNNLDIEVVKSNFNKIITVKIINKVLRKMVCGTSQIFILELINNDGNWKIKSITTYEFRI